jgi:hypothetical protein
MESADDPFANCIRQRDCALKVSYNPQTPICASYTIDHEGSSMSVERRIRRTDPHCMYWTVIFGFVASRVSFSIASEPAQQTSHVAVHCVTTEIVLRIALEKFPLASHYQAKRPKWHCLAVPQVAYIRGIATGRCVHNSTTVGSYRFA